MRKYRNAPLGIFDSGVGGLTVVKEISRHLPQEDIIYLGDTGRYPYGPRSAEIVRKFSLQNARFLMGFGIKVLIVACNTASSVALDELTEWITVPIMDVIKPGARAAVEVTRNGKIGVIGTVGTISSGAYQDIIMRLKPDSKVFTKSCPLFVPLAEEGWLDGEIPEKISRYYLNELQQKSIDTLVLGCTHYPLLKNVIQKVMDENVQIIDSATALVEELKNFLVGENLYSDSNQGQTKYFVTDAPQRFADIGTRFLDRKLSQINLIQIDN
ncbi:glutamate racemase [bacterium]|nr:MAG: glutamate racemase [bacterium]